MAGELVEWRLAAWGSEVWQVTSSTRDRDGSADFTCLQSLGRLNLLYFTCLESSGRLNLSYLSTFSTSGSRIYLAWQGLGGSDFNGPKRT